MIQHINDLVQFYGQRYHVPIEAVTDPGRLEDPERQGLVVGMPPTGATELAVGEARFHVDPEFGRRLGGDLIVVGGQAVGRVGPHSLMLHISPKNTSGLAFVRRVIDQQLPRLCRVYRHELRDALVNGIADCVQDRKKELQGSLREDNYELERLSLQVMQLSRKIESDRQILKLFEKSPEWIRARATRSFVDLMKLVPATYSSIWIEDDSVFGSTHPIEIEYDGCTYHFDEFTVEVDLRQGKVFISGGSNVNGYVHPHVSEERGNVCWGNVGHLVSRLAGEMDLFGLFQLVHQFLNTYNSSDPFQRIEKWDPHWVEDDEEDEPYCSWCDDYGHTVSECESCWWCDHCSEYVDHDEEDCPKRPKEEEEKEEADAELAESESA